MHFRSTALSLAGTLALAACTDPSAPTQGASPSLAVVGSLKTTGKQIVSFTSGVPADFASRVSALGGKVEWASNGSGLATVSGLSSSAVATLASSRGVASVDADEAIALDVPQIAAVDGEAGSTQSTNDPTTAVRYARQWNMRAVHADQAWAAGQLGASSTKVAILDTGIDYLHADLLGLVDLSLSADMLGTFDVELADGTVVPFTEADTVAKYFPGRRPFTDLFFHGTHVGATVSSNAVRAAGVTSKSTLIAVKVCAYLNTCPFSSILNGVLYATDNGADVINMSLGGGLAKAGNGRFVGLLNKTFNYARSKGVTVVVSAGNSALDLDHDGNNYETFCNTPSTICVAATGPESEVSVNGPWTNVDAHSWYSNFGRSAITVAAPGGNNASFVWAACSTTSLIVPACQTANIFILGAQGTSMAAPHVSGAAALLVQQLGRNPAQIRARLQQSADDLGQPGTDPFYGKGRLNVARAVGAI